MYLSGMEALELMLKKFIRSANVDKIMSEVLRDERLKDYIIELNQSQLYESGTDSNGQSLGQYQPYTVEIKRKKGQRTDHITLKDTGRFYNSFRIRVKSDGFEIHVKDLPGKDSLIYRYGIDILGLDTMSLHQIQDIFIREIKKALLTKILPGY